MITAFDARAEKKVEPTQRKSAGKVATKADAK